MHPFFFVASLFALASAVTAASDVCEPGYQLAPIEGPECVCKRYRSFDGPDQKPPNPDCKIIIRLEKRERYQLHCEATCYPRPSPKPKPKRNQPILMPDGTLSRCPSSMIACPLDIPPSLSGERATATISMSDSYECVKPSEDLYNCGGCSSTGQGTNCNAIIGVLGTSCAAGKCTIYTCQKGYTLVTNDQGARECVGETPGRA
ncbi:hypothetical protein FS749_011405 [Ceratobasidium sp. UAMH 11750]|nr:hypothetical protein FS749_011405 [Ceratobasidium sp. UAMH 11750]